MAVFQYDTPAPNPYAMSIAELMLHRGDIAAHAAETIAAANARAAEHSGAAWAGAVSDIGHSVAGTLQQINDPRRQLDAIALENAKREQAGKTAIEGLMKPQANAGPTQDGQPLAPSQSPYLKQEGDISVWDVDGLSKALAAQGLGLSTENLDKIGNLNKAHREEASARAAAGQAQQNVLAHGAGVALGILREHPDTDPSVLIGLVGQQMAANKTFPADQIEQVKQQLLSDPSQLAMKLEALSRGGSQAPIKLGKDDVLLNPNDPTGKPLASNLVPEKPTEASLAATANDPTKTPEQRAAAKDALVALQAPTVALHTETARHNAELERISRLTEGRQEAANAETKRHDLAMESANDAAPKLTPEGLKLVAHQYAMTGNLPPMGNGKAGAAVRTSVINEAASIYKDLDLPTQVAAYNANKASLTKLQGQRDAIGAFENTAKKNIDLFLDTAGKVVDTGSPLINTPLRMVSGKLLGSPDQAAFDAARQVAVNEIAKITSNPTLAGQLSDSARHEVEAFNPQNATLKQSVAVMRLLSKDMGNRIGSLDEQIAAIQQRIATPPGQKPATETPTAPKEGTTRTIGAETLTWKTVNGKTGWYR